MKTEKKTYSDFGYNQIRKLSLNRISRFPIMLFTIIIFSTSVVLAREVWRVTLSPPLEGQYASVNIASDGAFYRYIYWYEYDVESIYIYYHNLTRISPEGEIEWELNWHNGQHQASNWYVDDVGNNYFHHYTNNTDNNNQYLKKYSPDGNLVFDIVYELPFYEYNLPIYSIENIDKKGNITFIGEKTVFQCSNDEWTMYHKIGWIGGGTSEGVRTWSLTFGDQNTYSGEPVLRGVDNNGGSLIYYAIEPIICKEDCRLIPDCTQVTERYIAQIDRNGNIVWETETELNEVSNYYYLPSGKILKNDYTRTQLTRINTISGHSWTVTLPAFFYSFKENEKDSSVLIISKDNYTQFYTTYIDCNGNIKWQKAMKMYYAMFGPDGDIYGGSAENVIKRISSETGEALDSLNLLPGESMQGIDSEGAIYTRKGMNIFAKYTFGDYLTIRDANNDSIPNTEFEMYKVENDPPYFTEEYLGKFTTDDKGRLKYTTESEDTISVETDEGTKYFYDGDMLKITKQIHSEIAPRHINVPPTSMYLVHLDNTKFDDQGIVSFNKMGEDNWTEVILDHTEIRYNLLVSIEWDADQEYQYGLQKDFRAMSNYLYDVTDGQLRLDIIKIYDNKYKWEIADIQIRATNMHHPDAVPNAIYNFSYPINMPRKWLSGIPGNQQLTHDNFPFNQAYPINYRTMAHEFGHYALDFLDEYQFVNSSGDSLPAFARCIPRPTGNYGFMDYHYPDPEGGAMASEMSSSYRYLDINCRNTKQYFFNQMSCWDYFESNFEKEYNNIYAPILKPDIEDEAERLIPASLDYFPGPNSDLLVPDYDVGSKVIFTENVVAPASQVGSRLILVDNVAAGGVNVKLDIDDGTGNLNDPNNFYRTIDQGNTTDLGLLWVLGVNPLYDNVIVTGHSWSYTGGAVALLKSHVLTEVQKQWLFARSGFGTGDTTHITLQPIQGNYPLIFDASVNTVACDLKIHYTQPFNQIPSVKLIAQDEVNGYPAFSTGTAYNPNITGSAGESGYIRLSAVDGANHPFDVDVEYTVARDTGANFTKVIGPLGGIVVSVDSVNAGLEKMMILSSPYPVIRTGLTPSAIQAGQSHSLSVIPKNNLLGINNLSINYSDDDLKIGSNQTGDEADLQIYYWNKNESKWELTGGIADTELNTVTVSFTEPGVYAAFTNTIVTHSEEGFGLNPPDGFSLSQNYPNPFNRVTEIEFSLPKTSGIKLEIFNINGQLVRTLAANTFNAGKHKVKWNSRDNADKQVSPGIYLYRLTADEFVETKSMIFLK